MKRRSSGGTAGPVRPGMLAALYRDGQSTAALALLLKAAELAPGCRSPLVNERWAARRAAEAAREWALESQLGLAHAAARDPSVAWAEEEARHLRARARAAALRSAAAPAARRALPAHLACRIPRSWSPPRPHAGETVRPTLELLAVCVPEAEPLLQHCSANLAHWELVATKTREAGPGASVDGRVKREHKSKRGPNPRSPLNGEAGRAQPSRRPRGDTAGSSTEKPEAPMPRRRPSHKGRPPASKFLAPDAAGVPISRKSSASNGGSGRPSVGGGSSTRASDAAAGPAIVPGRAADTRQGRAEVLEVGARPAL